MLFTLTGRFYTLAGYACRTYLDIQRQDQTRTSPQITVIMMNPGSQGPELPAEAPATVCPMKPDPTQRQMIKLMQSAQLDYLRILNLSDLRESRSERFFALEKALRKTGLPHSLFMPDRQAELSALLTSGTPVVFAWGVNPKLQALIQQAQPALAGLSPLGLKKKDSTSAWYHPLPRTQKAQQDWLGQVSAQIRNGRPEDLIWQM